MLEKSSNMLEKSTNENRNIFIKTVQQDTPNLEPNII